eukprot:Hpha_TRINITY_DN30641_c0_g1::TRINITY_DN30641_c0_g1_i1::g.18366::m.18366
MVVVVTASKRSQTRYEQQPINDRIQGSVRNLPPMPPARRKRGLKCGCGTTQWCRCRPSCAARRPSVPTLSPLTAPPYPSPSARCFEPAFGSAVASRFSPLPHAVCHHAAPAIAAPRLPPFSSARSVSDFAAVPLRRPPCAAPQASTHAPPAHSRSAAAWPGPSRAVRSTGRVGCGADPPAFCSAFPCPPPAAAARTLQTDHAAPRGYRSPSPSARPAGEGSVEAPLRPPVPTSPRASCSSAGPPPALCRIQHPQAAPQTSPRPAPPPGYSWAARHPPPRPSSRGSGSTPPPHPPAAAAAPTPPPRWSPRYPPPPPPPGPVAPPTRGDAELSRPPPPPAAPKSCVTHRPAAGGTRKAGDLGCRFGGGR